MESAKQPDGEEAKAFKLDDLLVKELGGCGRYQLLALALLALPVVCGGLASAEFVFTTARIPSRCYIEQCDGVTPQFAADWLQWAVPADGASFSNCERFTNATAPPVAPADTCPAELFDQTRTEPCKSYVYENTDTIVYDFDLPCDEWRRALVGSARKLGSLVALPMSGYLSDRWGRRVVLAASAANMAWVGLARSFAPSYEWCLALHVLQTTIGGAGTVAMAYVMATELVSPKYRVAFGCTINTMLSLGHVLVGFIAWGVQSWRTLTRVLYLPQLLVVCYFWILPESVRWLLSKGQYEESERILKKVARVNKKELSEKSLTALRVTAEQQRGRAPPRGPWLPLQVLRSWTILLRCVIAPIMWITNYLVYFGMNINSVNLVGNRYLNYVAVAAVDIPGYWTAIFLLDRIGRKPVLLVFYFLCAACQFMLTFIAEGHFGISLTIYLVGKYAIAVTLSSVYVYTAELFPTQYRASFFAFSSVMGRFGSIVAPLTPALALQVWASLPSVLFGSMALLSGVLALAAPETLATRLPDTMLDAERLGETGSQYKN